VTPVGLLDGKVAAITGASSGIGEATAMALAAEGAAVSLAARRKDRLDNLAATIGGEGGAALPIETDITDEEQANAFISRTHDELGRLDILINNAGVMLLGPVAGAPTEQWRRMLDLNLAGLLYCTHAALPIMGEQGSGDIINVASVAGRIAARGSGVYNMTKWGVVGFTEALRQECARANVRVGVIEPGWVDTELQGHNEHPAIVEGMNKMIDAIDKVLEPADIARAITFAVTQPPHVSINEMLIRPTTSSR